MAMRETVTSSMSFCPCVRVHLGRPVYLLLSDKNVLAYMPGRLYSTKYSCTDVLFAAHT